MPENFQIIPLFKPRDVPRERVCSKAEELHLLFIYLFFMNIHKMFKKAIKDSFFRFKQKRTIHQLKSAATIASEKCDIEKIRNIGILAHIDAGTS